MILLEFLNRISFFSILAWAFYLIAALCGIILTTLSSPLARRYRRLLLSVGASCILLGTLAWSSPFFIRRLNPDQSRLTPIDQLTPTEWIEPIQNPETELANDEVSWAKALSYQFKYKIRFKEEFSKAVGAEGSNLVLLTQTGSLVGFNAYTGLNHWSIPLHANQVLATIQIQKKLYLLDRTSLDALRISCFDLQTPSLLWQRRIPNSKDGALAYDNDSQAIVISAGSTGVWSLKAKTGEILWKRPELYSKIKTVSSSKHVVLFEPAVAGKTGSWYFLDTMTGKTLSRIPHLFTEMQDFYTPETTGPDSLHFLAKIDPMNFAYLNHSDLSQEWPFHAESKVQILKILNPDQYLLYNEDRLLELRSLKNNELAWQKKLNLDPPALMKVSADYNWIALPATAPGESNGIAFYDLKTGDYRVTARTSENIRDLFFFGDWMYLFSENYLWAMKK